MPKFVSLGPPPPQPSAPPPAVYSIREASAAVTKPPKRPSPPDGTDSTNLERPPKIIKFKLESWQLQKFPPGPHIGSRPLTPKPQASPAKPPSTALQGVKMRIPLPNSAVRTPLPDPTSSPATVLPVKKPGGIKLKLNFGKTNQP